MSDMFSVVLESLGVECDHKYNWLGVCWKCGKPEQPGTTPQRSGGDNG